MKKQAFSSEQYLNLQRDHILERINQFDGKLYLEFGGKMLEDFHAARVLPGYEPDNKIKLLQELKDQVEVVIAINASNIEHSKARGDLGISYDQEVLRLIDKFNELNIYVGSVVITQYSGQPAADAFRNQLEKMASRLTSTTYQGYPTDMNHIILLRVWENGTISRLAVTLSSLLLLVLVLVNWRHVCLTCTTTKSMASNQVMQNLKLSQFGICHFITQSTWPMKLPLPTLMMSI